MFFEDVDSTVNQVVTFNNDRCAIIIEVEIGYIKYPWLGLYTWLKKLLLDKSF